MEKLYIICVDDQREVLSALLADLEFFESYLEVEECESAAEAWELINEIDEKGDFIAVIITDQVMPQNSGVEFLKQVKEDGRFSNTRKILLTGQATHQDTIEAINKAGLDNYIEKPWDKASLHQVIKVLLTKYMIAAGLDYKQFTAVIDSTTLYELLKHSTS